MSWIIGYMALSALATVSMCWLICRAKAQAEQCGYCDCAQGRFECTCGSGSDEQV